MFVAKNYNLTSWDELLFKIAPVQYVLHQLSCTYEMIPNAPKYYEMHRNFSLGSNWVDGVRWLQKITTRLRGTNFCINCISSVRFGTSFTQLRNKPKCNETHRNIGIGSNGVDWLRSLRKNPDVTLWHELLQ